MIVVADTSPINYLILIGQIDVLKHLYTRTLIPSAVLAELQHPATAGRTGFHKGTHFGRILFIPPSATGL